MSDNGYVSKADFLAALTGQEVDRDIPGLGKVRMRPIGIEEGEAIRQRNRHNGVLDEVGLAVEMISTGLVIPKLDASDAAALRKSKTGSATQLVNIIAEISGMSVSKETENLAGVGS